MSIPGTTPYYVLAHKRPDGLIDYRLMNPHGWSQDEVKFTPGCAARDEAQIRGRIQELVPPWQEEIEFRYVDRELP